MNQPSANAVLDALSSDIMERLKKGQPLDPDATRLYAELVKEAQVLKFGAPAFVDHDDSFTPRQRALKSLIAAHKATRGVVEDQAGADAWGTLATAQQEYEHALRAEMTAEARRNVLAMLQETLLTAIANLRMIDGDLDHIQKLEEKLLQTKLELAAMRDITFIVRPGAQPEG